MSDALLELDRSVDVLRAVAEPTRARIINVLRHGECSVTDLCEVLGQSQPRISRHLRLLVEAGICSRHREGTYAFFSIRRRNTPADGIADIVSTLLQLLNPEDPTLSADLSRLIAVRERRAIAALHHFADIAERWDRERSLLTPDDLVESEILRILDIPGRDLGSVIDIGTGTGRMLELLADSASRIVGLDSSPSMLRVARANLDRSGIGDVELRQSDIFATSISGQRFELAVIHQVLHFLDDPGRAIAAAADLLNSDGRLLIVDLPRHGIETLRSEHAHRRLGFTAEQIDDWLTAAGLRLVDHRTIDPPIGDTHRIAVALWLAEHIA